MSLKTLNNDIGLLLEISLEYNKFSNGPNKFRKVIDNIFIILLHKF